MELLLKKLTLIKIEREGSDYVPSTPFTSIKTLEEEVEEETKHHTYEKIESIPSAMTPTMVPREAMERMETKSLITLISIGLLCVLIVLGGIVFLHFAFGIERDRYAN